ncbi:MAG: MFS transporter, partial [Eubacteriales bacterium]
PANKALAAGLTMGLAGVLGALAVILIGSIADTYGLFTAVSILFCLPVVAGLIGLFMKSRPAEHKTRIQQN